MQWYGLTRHVDPLHHPACYRSSYGACNILVMAVVHARYKCSRVCRLRRTPASATATALNIYEASPHHIYEIIYMHRIVLGTQQVQQHSINDDVRTCHRGRCVPYVLASLQWSVLTLHVGQSQRRSPAGARATHL